MSLSLRPYQEKAVADVRARFAAGYDRVILQSCTGSGKTEMALFIIKSAISKGKRIAFLCNRITLVEQSSRRFKAAGVSHGVIQGGSTRDPTSPVVVASIQTVANRGLPEVDLIIIDECHTAAGSKAYRDIIARDTKTRVLGLSATPWSKGLGKDYKELGGALFESVVIATTVPELIAQGWLVDVEVWAPSEPDLSKVSTVAGDYNERELGEAVDKPALIGDIIKHWFKHAKGKPTVVFATNIAHSEHIRDEFLANDITAEHIDCYTLPAERVKIFERVRSGETLVVTNVGVLAEGWDFPACEVMILARPTKSLIRYIQMVGRVLRSSPGKTKAIILDHSGSCERLGYPTDHIERELCDGKPKPASASKEKKEKLPKKCVKCHHLKPAGVSECPACGYKPTRKSDVEVEDGTLQKLERKGATKMTSKEYLATLPQQEVWSGLLSICKPAAASYRFKEIFGTHPANMGSKPGPASQSLIQWERSRRIAYRSAMAGGKITSRTRS